MHTYLCFVFISCCFLSISHFFSHSHHQQAQTIRRPRAYYHALLQRESALAADPIVRRVVRDDDDVSSERIDDVSKRGTLRIDDVSSERIDDISKRGTLRIDDVSKDGK